MLRLELDQASDVHRLAHSRSWPFLIFVSASCILLAAESALQQARRNERLSSSPRRHSPTRDSAASPTTFQAPSLTSRRNVCQAQSRRQA